MTFKLQHPFTIIAPGPSICCKYTFVIRLLECRELHYDVFENVMWCHSENSAPHLLKNVSFVKGIPYIDNPENVPTFAVLDDLMYSAFSKKSEPIIYQRIT